MTDEQFAQLGAQFAIEEVKVKIQSYTKKRDKALVVAYIDNRAIMKRLDDVCGPANWKNRFKKAPDGGVLCGISIRVVRDLAKMTAAEIDAGHTTQEWITKWDGAENTDIESVKGGLSSSMRRAAVQWGMGRYLYAGERVYAPVDGNGYLTVDKEVLKMRLLSGNNPTPPQKSRAKASAKKAPAKKKAALKPTNGETDNDERDNLVMLISSMLASFAIKGPAAINRVVEELCPAALPIEAAYVNDLRIVSDKLTDIKARVGQSKVNAFMRHNLTNRVDLSTSEGLAEALEQWEESADHVLEN